MSTAHEVAPASSPPINGGAQANDYRLFLHVDGNVDDLIDRSVSQLAAWLSTQKHWEPRPRLDVDGYITDAANGRDLLTLHRASSAGREFRARLTESTSSGIWRTQLTVQQATDGNSWLAIRVANSEGRWVAVPKLATFLLDALPLMDGHTAVAPTVPMIGPSQVEDILDQICDSDRAGLLLLAGTRSDDIDVRLFRDQVERWTRQVKGLAQVAVLSPPATEAVREALGDDHAVRPWTLRTFLPAVDPAIAGDSARHRYLSHTRLASESDEAIRKLLGRVARRHMATLPTDPAYLRADKALRRLEDRLLVDGLLQQLHNGDPSTHVPAIDDEQTPGETAPPSTEPSNNTAVVIDGAALVQDAFLATAPRTPEVIEGRALSEMVKRILHIEDVTEETLVEFVRRAQQAQVTEEAVARFRLELERREDDLDVAKAELENLQDAYQEMQLDERISAERAGKLEDEARWLRRQLQEHGEHEAAYSAVPDDAYTDYPVDFSELHGRLDDMVAHGILFTGKNDSMLALDVNDTLGKLVATAWEAVLALADYLRARRDGLWGGNVKGYLENTPRGYRNVPPKKYAESETKETMKHYGAERIFPVPTEIDATGFAAMKAHFKLGRVGMVSPRLYYLDCYATTGKIYIGYIGEHLTNTQTN